MSGRVILPWLSINPLRFIFCHLRSTDFEEEKEGLACEEAMPRRQRIVKQCLHNKSDSHGVPDINLFDFNVSPGRLR